MTVSFIGGGNQSLSHNFVSSTPRHELKTYMVIGTDCTGSCKSNCHMFKTTIAPNGE